MKNNYSDIKRYDLRKEFLYEASRKVINCLGWAMQIESEDKLYALVYSEKQSLLSKINITIHQGYIVLYCECENESEIILSRECKTRVEHFLKLFDNYIKMMTPDLLQKNIVSHRRSLIMNYHREINPNILRA